MINTNLKGTNENKSSPCDFDNLSIHQSLIIIAYVKKNVMKYKV
jgi:hypothetical protein